MRGKTEWLLQKCKGYFDASGAMISTFNILFEQDQLKVKKLLLVYKDCTFSGPNIWTDCV